MLYSVCSCSGPAQVSPKSITVHLRGVSESNISVIPLTGQSQLKPITGVNGIRNGAKAELKIPGENLPGVFVLRFDYKEKPDSKPYPLERRIVVNDQDLVIRVNPVYGNHPDSTLFQKNERENTAYTSFLKENGRMKEKLGVLQQFLMSYDDTRSDFYQMGIGEYNKRRQEFNQWLETRIRKDQALFAVNLYRFQHVPEISWAGSENDRISSLIAHFFDGMDFKDPAILKAPDLTEWMDSYVNLHAQMAVTPALRDSVIPAAARRAIEKAKTGHPKVYGWMVDYFYKGFEANNIPEGMKTLAPYLNDPNCLTTKKLEIEKRLQGMKTLVNGSVAPNIRLKSADGNLFELNTFKTSAKYILLLFWSADCNHCNEMADALYPWHKQAAIAGKLSVVAVSLDETATEIAAWNRRVPGLKGWNHLLAPEGIRSQAASDYYVLATPVMILIDSKTRKIVAQPGSVGQLQALVE